MRKLIILLLVLLISFPALAENRFVLGVKNGAGYGTIGVELEKEFSNQWSIQAGTGKTETTAHLVGGVRKYFAPDGNRWFAGGYVSLVGDGEFVLPLVGGTGGYEWKIGDSFRITLEGGLAFLIIIPLPSVGVSAGITF